MQRSKDGQLEETILFGCLALLIFSLACREVSDADIWFDLVAGIDIFSGRFLKENFFSYVEPHHKWLNLHWLYDLILFLIVKVGGIPLAVFSTTFLWIIIFRLLWLASRARENPRVATLLLAMSASVITDRFVIRSEIASYFFLSLFLFALEKSKANNSPKILHLLPLAQALWANMHAYWVIGTAYLIATTSGGWLACRKSYIPFRNSLALPPQINKRLTKISLLCLIIPIVNPYLLEGYLAPFSISNQLRSGNIFRELVAENKSPLHEWGMVGDDFLYLFLLYTIIVVISCFVNRRNINPLKLFFSAGFLILSLQAQRMLPIFVLLSAPIMINNLSSLETNIKGEIRYAITGAVSVMLILFAFLVIRGDLWLRNLREIKFGWQVSPYRFPMEAVAFMKENAVAGKVFNSLDYGGYLLWEFRPNMRVFFDGRMEACYSANTLKQYFFALQNHNEWEDLDKLYNFGAVLLNPTSKADQPLIEYLALNTEWKLAYLDWTAILFVKIANNPTIPALSLPQKKEKIPSPPTDRPWALIALGQAFELLRQNEEALECYQKAVKLFPTYPIGWDSLGRILFSLGKHQEAIVAFKSAIKSDRRYTPALYNLGSAYLRLGNYQEAIKYLQQAVERSPSYIEARMNLAAAYLHSNNQKSAIEQYHKVLKREPTNQDALKMINLLKKP